MIELNIHGDGLLRTLKLAKCLNNLMHQRQYDIVHVNTGNLSVEAVSLLVAKYNKIPRRIAHSHSTIIKKSFLYESIRIILRQIINNCSTERLACSRSAAKSFS